MILERLQGRFAHMSKHTELVDEHEAVVDLLVLTAYSDHRITQGELDELESFDATHKSWDDGGFSVQQYLPTSISKVRHALEGPGGADVLLSDVAGRIHTPAVRREALSACRALADSDGESSEDVAFLRKAEVALASSSG